MGNKITATQKISEYLEEIYIIMKRENIIIFKEETHSYKSSIRKIR